MRLPISILIVDDLDKKRLAVSSLLELELKTFEVRFEYADRYETARDRLATNSYDFVILDIKIPAGAEAASEKWSRQLLREILDGAMCLPMHVFGLTEHHDIMEAERHYYESSMFGLLVFQWDNNSWAQAIANKIRYLALAVHNGAAYRLNSFSYDVVVLAARFENEFKPIKKVLFGNSKGTGHPLWPDMAHIGIINLRGGKKLRAALICIGPTGLSPAAALTSQALQVLRPKLVAMLGMCAGFESRGVKIMDVLIAREAACLKWTPERGPWIAEVKV
jgi:CheY-like chemotaxis protein